MTEMTTACAEGRADLRSPSKSKASPSPRLRSTSSTSKSCCLIALRPSLTLPACATSRVRGSAINSWAMTRRICGSSSTRSTRTGLAFCPVRKAGHTEGGLSKVSNCPDDHCGAGIASAKGKQANAGMGGFGELSGCQLLITRNSCGLGPLRLNDGFRCCISVRGSKADAAFNSIFSARHPKGLRHIKMRQKKIEIYN